MINEIKFVDRLPYVEATILELLRFKTVVPLAMPHQTLRNTEVGGYFIPAETMVCEYCSITIPINVRHANCMCMHRRNISQSLNTVDIHMATFLEILCVAKTIFAHCSKIKQTVT